MRRSEARKIQDSRIASDTKFVSQIPRTAQAFKLKIATQRTIDALAMRIFDPPTTYHNDPRKKARAKNHVDSISLD
jgi:hypothetical protein